MIFPLILFDFEDDCCTKSKIRKLGELYLTLNLCNCMFIAGSVNCDESGQIVMGSCKECAKRCGVGKY